MMVPGLSPCKHPLKLRWRGITEHLVGVKPCLSNCVAARSAVSVMRRPALQIAGGWFIDWEQEDCSMNEDDWAWLETIPDYGADPEHMMGTWISMLVYLLTDCGYLHE